MKFVSHEIETKKDGRKIVRNFFIYDKAKSYFVELSKEFTKDQRKEILLGIDIQTNHIYNLIETGKKGTKTTLTVNSFKTNQPLSKNQFTFVASKYPNYYINKLD